MKLVYLVSYHVMPCNSNDLLLTYAERVFLTEDKAKEYALQLNKGDSEGYEHVCPSEGTKEWHQYFVEPIVMEES